MLHEPDDMHIRLVAQGLMTLAGPAATVTELGRLYGRERAIRALRNALEADQRGTAHEVVIDLAEPQPVMIDLRDGHARTRMTPASQRAKSVYRPLVGAAGPRGRADRTFFM